jgi:hypothetical protein
MSYDAWSWCLERWVLEAEAPYSYWFWVWFGSNS